MDLRQSSQYARYLRATGWEIEKLGKTMAFLKPIIFGLKISKIQRYSGLDMDRLGVFLRHHKIFLTILEPEVNASVNDYARYRIYPNHSPYLPTKTLVIDLTKPEKKLWSDLSQNLKRILKQKASTVLIQSKPDEFYRAWQKNSKLWPMSKYNFDILLSCFTNKAMLFASSLKGELVSGILVLVSGDAAYYYQAWTSDQGRKLNAHHHLTWETLLRLKARGIKKFDFDGIEDKRFPHASWRGFSEFKLKFGGKVVEYPGSFRRWF